MVSILITLAILAVIFYLVQWAIGAIPIVAPFDMIIRFIVIVYIVLYLVGLLTGTKIPFMWHL